MSELCNSVTYSMCALIDAVPDYKMDGNANQAQGAQLKYLPNTISPSRLFFKCFVFLIYFFVFHDW